MSVYQVHTDDGSVYEVHTENTLAEKAVNTMMAPYQAGANLDVSSPKSLGMAGLQALTPSGIVGVLEGAGNQVKGASTAALGNLLTSNKIPGQNYPTARGAVVGGLDTILSLAPFTPSGFASYTPIPSMTTSPESIQQGVGKYAQVMAGGEQVSPEMAGQTLKKGYADTLQGLKQKESQAYGTIEDKLKNSSGVMDNTVKYIKNLFGMDTGAGIGQGNVGDVISGNAGGGVNAQGIPLSIIRKQYPDYTPPPTTESLRMMEQANPAMPARDYGIFARILKVGQKENITVNDIKQLRTAVGQRIDWNAPRGDELNYNLKNLYQSLGEDYASTAEKAGFGNEANAARQATKDVYGFLDKRTIEQIGKNEYPEDLLNSMMSKNSPSRVTEMMDSLNLDDAGKQRLQKSVIQKLVRDNTSATPNGGQVDVGGLGTDIQRLKNSGFLDSLYGKNAPEIKTLGDIADYASGQKSGGRYVPMPWKYRLALRVLGGLMDMKGSESGVLNMARQGGGVNPTVLGNMINPPSMLSNPLGRLPIGLSRRNENQ